MKWFVCDYCHSVLPFGKNQKKNTCTCGRISAKYDSAGISGIVYLYPKTKAEKIFHRLFKKTRCVAVDTYLLQGIKKRSLDYIMDWKESGLAVYVNGKLWKDRPHGYFKENGLVFLSTAIQCLVPKTKKEKAIRRDLKLLKQRIKRQSWKGPVDPT